MIITNGVYCVYVHINKINGKMYVGQTVYGNNPNLRWHDGNGYKSSPHFWSAIQKYGWDNFDHEIVANNLTSEEADKFEKLLIKKLNTMDSNYGYNLTSGGNKGAVLSAELRKQHSEKMKGRFVGSLSPVYGKKQSKETIEKIRKSLAKKYVWCFELNKLFYSVKEAHCTIGSSEETINGACKGEKEWAGRHPETNDKLHWCYVEKESLKSIDSINLLIDNLILKWQEIVNNFILSDENSTKNIFQNKDSKNWYVRISYNNSRYNIGTYNTKEEAIQARLIAERRLYANIIKSKKYEDFVDLLKELPELSHHSDSVVY